MRSVSAALARTAAAGVFLPRFPAVISHRTLATKVSGAASRRERRAERPRREFFFYVSTNGQIYHLDGPDTVSTPSGPTHVNDARFKDFFMRNLRERSDAERADEEPLGVPPEFPFVSLCAGELNFVRAADRPVVFQRLARAGSEGEVDELVYGASLKTPFLPDELWVSRETGLLHHPSPQCRYGSFRTALAMELGEHLKPAEFGEDSWAFDWGGRWINVPVL
jgi:Domain of unknown function (DUF4505)